jgi:hypothetical protein
VVTVAPGRHRRPGDESPLDDGPLSAPISLPPTGTDEFWSEFTSRGPAHESGPIRAGGTVKRNSWSADPPGPRGSNGNGRLRAGNGNGLASGNGSDFTIDNGNGYALSNGNGNGNGRLPDADSGYATDGDGYAAMAEPDTDPGWSARSPGPSKPALPRRAPLAQRQGDAASAPVRHAPRTWVPGGGPPPAAATSSAALWSAQLAKTADPASQPPYQAAFGEPQAPNGHDPAAALTVSPNWPTGLHAPVEETPEDAEIAAEIAQFAAAQPKEPGDRVRRPRGGPDRGAAPPRAARRSAAEEEAAAIRAAAEAEAAEIRRQAAEHAAFMRAAAEAEAAELRTPPRARPGGPGRANWLPAPGAPTGPSGYAAPAGPSGYAAPAGPSGYAGPGGPNGFPGPVGPTGPNGFVRPDRATRPGGPAQRNRPERAGGAPRGPRGNGPARAGGPAQDYSTGQRFQPAPGYPPGQGLQPSGPQRGRGNRAWQPDPREARAMPGPGIAPARARTRTDGLAARPARPGTTSSRSETQNRQKRAGRGFIAAAVVSVLFAAGAGTTELALHGFDFGFFTERQAAGETEPNAPTDQEFLANQAHAAAALNRPAEPQARHAKTSQK